MSREPRPGDRPSETPSDPSPAAPLEPADVLALFSTCHARMAAPCAALRQRGLWAAAGDGDAATAAARQASAAQLLRFFDGAAEQHHRDEEQLLFPALLESMAGSDPVCLRELTDGLTAEHREMAAAWRRLRPVLERVAAGPPPATQAASVAQEAQRIAPMAQVAEALADLCQRHLDCEERELLPMAARLIADDEWRRIGCAMQARRAAR